MLQTRLGETRGKAGLADDARLSGSASKGDIQFALHLTTRTLLASLPDYKMVWNSTHPAYNASNYAFYGLELLTN